MTSRHIGTWCVAALVAALALPAAVAAQGNPALAGRWELAPGGGRGGIRGIPIATELTIRISPAEVAVDSDTGSARAIQTFLFKLDGTETDVPGPLGWKNTGKARWDGDTLVVSTRRTLEGGPVGPMSVDVTDVFVVAGDVLTIERAQGRSTDRLVYNRKP
jgi:hypothetical protein